MIFGKLVPYQAEATLRNFKDFDKFQYNLKDFPRRVKIRKKYPLLSVFPMALLAFFVVLYNNKVWKNGFLVLKLATFSFIYYLHLGYYIYALKTKKKPRIKDF